MVVNQTQGAQSKGIVTTESGEDNMPLTVLLPNLKLKQYPKNKFIQVIT